jgi:hypothetical protein
MTRGEDPTRDRKIDRVYRRGEHLDRLAAGLIDIAQLRGGADLVDQRGFQRALTIGSKH